MDVPHFQTDPNQVCTDRIAMTCLGPPLIPTNRPINPIIWHSLVPLATSRFAVLIEYRHISTQF